jgi:hypothetical protein
MAEQHPLTTERVAASPDWATLTERALDDVSRVVRSEIHMLQTSIETAAETRTDSVVTRNTPLHRPMPDAALTRSCYVERG